MTLKVAGLKVGASLYLGKHDPRLPLASPLYADLHGFPSLLMQADGDELLLENIQAFARRVREAGGAVNLEVWPGMFHVWR
ncbi:alpha/beta hydrolase fold domain-containing protein [Deinococcus sp.]|uniref:alpha/beta hydrolase fold domain-containing protein n=1 Tax=Deinococcus sp. TaxID=47478 RepID=UPI003C7EA8DB